MNVSKSQILIIEKNINSDIQHFIVFFLNIFYEEVR